MSTVSVTTERILPEAPVRQRHHAQRLLMLASAVIFLVYAGSLVAFPREGASNVLWDGWVYSAWMWLGLAALVMRAADSRRMGSAWLLTAVSVAVFYAAEMRYNFVDSSDPTVTAPELSDVLYTVSYLVLAVALLLFSRRGRSVGWMARLDGLVMGLSAAALAAVFGAQAALPPGTQWDGATLVSVGYLLFDMVFVMVLVGGLAPMRFRVTPAIAMVFAGVTVLTLADFVYLQQVAHGSYGIGTVLDVAWPLGYFLIMLSSLFPNPFLRNPNDDGRWTTATPAVASLLAIAVLGRSLLNGEPEVMLANTLALLAVLLSSIRLMLTMSALRRVGEGYEQARTDNLTGLVNRRGFVELLDRWLADRSLDDSPGMPQSGGALLLIDLDGFKEVNDSLGHAAGDQVLVKVAVDLKTVAGDYLVARLGGDEFAMLVTDLNDLHRVLADIAVALSEPIKLDGLSVLSGGSIGVARCPRDGYTRESLLRAADVAMYQAKRSGADFAEFDPVDDPASTKSITLMADLHGGIDRGELVLAYQPIIDVSSGRVAGMEALVRWDHPALGRLHPETFIPAAENAGLIGRITRNSLAMACADWARWAASGTDIGVSVNISAIDLIDTNLPSTVAALLTRCNMPPERLTVEITETAAASDPARATATCARLRDLGVRTSIDDFGVGYSSLSQLMDLPIDEIKVDKRFLKEADREKCQGVLLAAITIADALDASVVAEGVEEASGLELLAQVGCHHAQGYYFARPMGPEDVPGYIGARGAQVCSDSADR